MTEAETDEPQDENPFDEATWAQLPALLAHLPEPVHIVVWGDATAPGRDGEAILLCQTLADEFDTISTQTLPRRINYDYWPVLGVMLGTAVDYEDVGVRLIGVPDGYQMTSFITAIQAVSFKGMTTEALTRIKLSRLEKDVGFELITAADNEAGALMAQPLFNMAVTSKHIKTYLIMSDQFPVVLDRYSVNFVPHTVINSRAHIEGVVAENEILNHVTTVLS